MNTTSQTPPQSNIQFYFHLFFLFLISVLAFHAISDKNGNRLLKAIGSTTTFYDYCIGQLLEEVNAPTHIAYQVREGSQKGYWTRIGAAWAHKDGKGFSIQLECMPLDGKINLRVASEI